ncbi:hypothetical protein CEXT_651211 [Caerostris extrusa]|uniref:Uncharacterized protein n=1 Tax=Caerostris extrusa TaxID=172846 RepID=A0AAV4Y6K6_CAEEX|nr:hypothetical protein CEXT_651211 [Caerostris extrusa]
MASAQNCLLSKSLLKNQRQRHQLPQVSQGESALKAWVAVCRRSDEFDPENVPSVPNIFDQTISKETCEANCWASKRKILKPNAFPTLKLPDKDGMNPSFEKGKKKDVVKTEKKDLVSTL